MEILELGTPPQDAYWVGTCRICKTKAKAKATELKHINTGDYRSEGSFAWEVCPVCGGGDKNTGYGGICFYPTKP